EPAAYQTGAAAQGGGSGACPWTPPRVPCDEDPPCKEKTMPRAVAAALVLLAAARAPGALPPAKPADVGIDPLRLARVDAAVEEALKRGSAPGAVVLVVRKGKVVHRKAYGSRALKPAKEAMTADTVFDLASLTKPLATATSVMLLLERGKLRLS